MAVDDDAAEPEVTTATPPDTAEYPPDQDGASRTWRRDPAKLALVGGLLAAIGVASLGAWLGVRAISPGSSTNGRHRLSTWRGKPRPISRRSITMRSKAM